MKFTKQILAGIAALALVVPAFGQGNFDYFAAPKTLVLSAPQLLSESGATTLLTTNTASISRFLGIVALDVYSLSNSAGAAILPTNTFTIQTSPTGTNAWTTITNAAFATSTTVITTNYWGITNSSVAFYTNTFMIPGTISNAVVGLNGFSGQWTQPAQYTSSGTANSGPSQNWTIGFDADNQGNFIQIIWSTSGSNAIYGVSAVLRGRTKGGIY